MIVRDLLIKLGFAADTSAVDRTDRKIDQVKKSSQAAATAAGMFASQLAMMGAQRAAQELQEAAEASLNFGRSMANVSALMGGNQKRTLELADGAKTLGKEFGVLPAEVSQAMYGVIGNLGDTKDTMDQVRASMKLGKAGAASTAEGFSLLSAVTRAYGDTSGAAMDRTSDLAAAAVRLGSLTLPELSASIQSVTPVAASLGVSLEELFAVQASLSGVTGNASEVYTQMQSAMTALLKKTPEMEKAFKKAFRGEGIKTTAEAIGKYGLQGTLQKLAGTTNGTQEQMVDLFGRIEGVRFALAVTGNQANDYKSKLQQMRQATGEVDSAVRAQTTGMGAQAFALDKAKAAAAAQQIELGDRLTPAYVELFRVGGMVAELFGKEIVPLFESANGGVGTLGVSLEDLHPIFKAIQVVVAGVAVSLDGLVTYIKMVVTGLGTAAAMAKGLIDRDPRAMDLALTAGIQEQKNLMGGFYDRTKNRAALVAGVETSEMANVRTGKEARAKVAAADAFRASVSDRVASASSFLGGTAGGGGGLASLVANMGGVAINVTVPSGTEAQSAARIGDTGARVLLAQLADGVKRAFPVQSPAGAQ